MTLRSFKLKLIAAFVLLFICLNAGGAVCVAYCRGVMLAAMDDHCPLANQERHCDKSEPSTEGEETAIAAGEIDCCPMIVSFIPGTFEAKQNVDFASLAILPSNFSPTLVARARGSRFLNIPAYRGPPKDERVLHITNRILRI